MQILGPKGLSGKVKCFLDIVFVGGLGIFITLPLLLKWYLKFTNRTDAKQYYFLLVLLYVSGVFALTILNELRKILKTINRMNPFMMDNVESLNTMGICAFVISGCYLVKIIFFNSVLTMIIAMTFIIAGLFSIILAEVFKQAVMAKEENDLTI